MTSHYSKDSRAMVKVNINFKLAHIHKKDYCKMSFWTLTTRYFNPLGLPISNEGLEYKFGKAVCTMQDASRIYFVFYYTNHLKASIDISLHLTVLKNVVTSLLYNLQHY